MEGIPDDMWSPFKQLYKVIEQTILNPTEEATSNLEMYLKRHRQIFANLLRNPPKNERNRTQLRTHITQGVPITGNNRTLILSKDLVDECIIISDMFDMDEFLALELLCTAQRQMHQYAGLPRGLIAVLLYYDGRKAIANSLRDLFQITSGVSWVSEVPNELISLTSSFTQSLVDDTNVLERIIELLDELDVTKETAMLMKNRALGTNKHQNQVFELYEDIRMSLAMALFNWSAQRGLPRAIIIKLYRHLLISSVRTEANGEMDDTTITLIMAMLYAYDTSILQKQDDNRFIQNMNIIKDKEFVQQLYMTLMNETANSSMQGIQNLIKFSFGLAISGLRHASQYLQNYSSVAADYDEQLVDDAICGYIFKFIHDGILEKSVIYKNQFFYRRLHMLFTDFIDFMHSKVTELRGRADETAKTIVSFTNEGLEPPNNLDRNFEMLLLCIGKFYKGNKAGLSLCVEYWGPLESSSTNYVQTTRSVSLFKFIRLAGELLPTTLFVPYLKMIAGLASCERSARSTFNLLKQAAGLTGSAALSWEHFFSSLSRYYTNLKQDYCASSQDLIYRNRIMNRNINPEEIEGLRAVLEVVRAVSTYDDVARIAICEHPNWNPLYTLIGLLSCSVPVYLKSDILLTLAALASSKETAIPLWNNLEASQIIKTIPAHNAYDNVCHLEVEIEQNECRLERYPLSQSILDLLYSLVTTIIPKNLGAGPRKPGIDPYLKFIINGLLLKFYNRSYKDSGEKWQIGSKCLKLIYFLLNIYEVNPKDFLDTNDSHTPPGFHIMLQLHCKSDMLRLLLQIIDDARLQLDDCRKFKGKEHLEESALLCLKILKLGLKYQDIFFDAHSNANSNILLSGLNKILLDVNPRSKKPDHILNTTYFLTYFNWLPGHALEAVKILHMISKQPSVNLQIVGIFTQNENIKNVIRQGFVECLESDYIPSASATTGPKSEDNTEYLLTDTEELPTKINLQIKEAIIQLMQDCLQQPSPNLGQFLLGFDHLKDLQILYKTHSRHGALLELENNCTKSLITLLETHLEAKRNNILLDVDNERIVERSFCLLYTLCSSSQSSDQILRYLRTRQDFLCRYLLALPLQQMENSHNINQISYLLKCIAIELKITATNCQLTRFQHISEIFVGISAKSNKPELSSAMELNHFYNNSTTTNTSHLSSVVKSNNILSEFLNIIDLDAQVIAIPQWDFFERTLIDQILKECEYKTDEGHKLIDLKKMHLILHNELKMVQTTIASGQRRLILLEIESVLVYGLKVNEQRNKRYATVKFIEAWGLVTEILFSYVTSGSCLPKEKKQELIIEILQKILIKVTPKNQIIFEISVIISGTILLLLVNLRCCFFNNMEYDLKQIEAEAEIKQNHLSKSNTLNLKSILKYILEWIIVSGVSSQKLRINLYASLLNCLSIIRDQSLKISPSHVNENQTISRLDKSKGNSNDSSSNIRITIEVLLSFGDKLMEIICHDCIAGHEICKMSALACIDVLLDIDTTMSNFMQFIAHHGYLSHIVESLAKSDDDLCNTLSNVPENMKYLYVYESKMSMLLRLANTHAGAELLLSHKVLDILSSMKVFDMHPDLKRKEIWQRDEIMREEFVPAIDSRFRQILFPALTLCDCLVTTLGTENYSVISQIMHFLLSHCDMIEIVLRSGSPISDLGQLQEISLITGIIARTFNQEIFSLGSSDAMGGAGDIGVNLYRIKKLMLSVYLRFIVSDMNFKEMLKPNHTLYDQSNENAALHITYFLEIAANLTLFCRNIVTNNSVDHRTNGLLFSPNIQNESVHMVENRNSSVYHHYNLGIIINQLKGSVEYYHSQKAIFDGLLRQRSALISSSFDSSANEKYLQISKQHEEKQNQLSLCVFIIEQCLYLLWSHLDYYMRYTSSPNRDIILLYCDPMRNVESKNGLHFTNEELLNLKKILISVFNETFSKKLCSIMDMSQDTETDFNNALLRRIKSLIQFFPVN